MGDHEMPRKRTIGADLYRMLLRTKKFLMALLGAAVTASLTLSQTSGEINVSNWREFIPTGVAFLTALGVYKVKNREQG